MSIQVVHSKYTRIEEISRRQMCERRRERSGAWRQKKLIKGKLRRIDQSGKDQRMPVKRWGHKSGLSNSHGPVRSFLAQFSLFVVLLNFVTFSPMALIHARYALDAHLRGKASYFYVHQLIKAFQSGNRQCPARNEHGVQCGGQLREVPVKEEVQVKAAAERYPDDKPMQLGCTSYRGREHPGCRLMIHWRHYMAVTDPIAPLTDDTVYCPAVDCRRVFGSTKEWEDAFQAKMAKMPLPHDQLLQDQPRNGLGADKDDNNQQSDNDTKSADDDDDGADYKSSRRHSSYADQDHRRTQGSSSSNASSAAKGVISSSSSGGTGRVATMPSTPSARTSVGVGSAGASSSSLSAPRGRQVAEVKPKLVSRGASIASSSGNAKTGSSSRQSDGVLWLADEAAADEADLSDDVDGASALPLPATPQRAKPQSRKRTIHENRKV